MSSTDRIIKKISFSEWLDPIVKGKNNTICNIGLSRSIVYIFIAEVVFRILGGGVSANDVEIVVAKYLSDASDRGGGRKRRAAERQQPPQ